MTVKTRKQLLMSECEINAGFETLLFLIPYPVFIKNSDFKYIWVNQALTDFLGMSIEDIIGRDDFDIFPEDYSEKLRRTDERMMNGEMDSTREELFLKGATGNERWFNSVKSVVKNRSGRVVGIAGVAVDITEGKVAKAELEFLEPAINQTTEAVFITDLDAVIKYVNPAFETLTGYSIDEVVGRKPSILKSGRQSDDYYANLWRTITAGETWSGHFINKRKDGSEYDEDATISPVRDKNGVITHFIGVKKDVTKIVELENKIRQSQKMEAVGRLAGGVAHDFNNILTAILGYSEILLGTISPSDPAHRKVEEIKKAGQRASDITKQMLAFSKKQVMRLAPLNANGIIENMFPMLEEIARDKARIKLQLNKELPDVLSDKIHIERIVMNLVVNAVEAMAPDGGDVISTDSSFIAEPFSDGNFTVPPGDYVLISVVDEGCGMTDEVIKHIFEPFFTNKSGGRGTGLGLSTVYGIVKQHNGFIVVDSSPEKGAEFNIMIPALISEDVSPMAETDHGDGACETFDGGSPTLLIVDDETSLLEMMFESFSAIGYTVLQSTSGTEALELFLMAEQKVDLVVSDIILHGMTGIELAEEIRETAPEMPVVFISGYTGNEYGVLSLESELNEFLPKPFVMEDLEGKVKLMLNKRRLGKSGNRR
ncbi:MAG: PAS domain S-box protein [Kiritimatiellaeota bacterium]|nr:PAS domain S-box protein [Kiritimatiellota bacterium]